MRELAARPLTDNVIRLFLPFRYDEDQLPDELKRDLAEVRAAPESSTVLPPDVLKSLQRRPVWRPHTTFSCSSDLHPQVRRLLGVDTEDPSEAGARAFVLTQEARRLLRGMPMGPTDDTPKKIELSLSKLARQRLDRSLARESPEIIKLLFEDLTLFYFRTGHAIAFAEIRCVPEEAEGEVPAAYLVEAVAAIDRKNHLRWPSNDEETKTRFDLASFIVLLIGEAAKDVPRRLYCYSFASFAEPVERTERNWLATQLSRRYTDDYALTWRARGTRFAQPFANVTHAFGVEGAATLVDDCQRSSFLASFGDSAVDHVYLAHCLVELSRVQSPALGQPGIWSLAELRGAGRRSNL